MAYQKTKRHVLTSEGYKTLSQWTAGESVEMANGNNLETEVTNLKAVATTAANGMMSSANVTKLNGIEDGANKYVHPTATSHAQDLYKVGVDAKGHVTSAAKVAKSDITALGIPAQDTTYGAATTGANGLMTSAQVTKLNGIAEGANKYVHPEHTSAAEGFYKVTVDGEGHVTSAARVGKDDITILGIPAQDTTYANASTAAPGLMSKADYAKLAAVEDGANRYVHPTATSHASGLYKVTVDGTGHVSATANVAKADITKLGIPAQDTTYAAASASANGLMTSAQFSKLAGIEDNANKYVHPEHASAAEGLYKVTVDGEGHVTSATAVVKGDITALGIPAQDTTYVHPTATSRAIGMYKVKVDGTGHVTSATAIAKADITGLGIPAQDTTYGAATTGASGLMTSAQVTKLNGIAAGAQVNTITGIKGDSESTYRTGNVNITAANVGAIPASEKGAASGVVPLNASSVIDSKYLPSYVDDVLEFPTRADFPETGESGKIYVDVSQEENNTYRWSGSTYILIAKNTNTTYSIIKSGSNIKLVGSDGSETSVTDSNTTYSAATASKNGLMTSAAFTKLDGIENGANKYVHPTATSYAAGLYKVTVDGTGHVTSAASVSKDDITALGVPSSNTTYGAATTAAQGLMTTAQVSKLDGIAAGANKYVHPTATSRASGLYKVTVDGTGHISAATTVAKADITGLGIPAQDTTYAAASASANGLMTSAQFSKLNGIAEGANNYVHPEHASAAEGLYKVTVDGEGHVTSATAVVKGDITALGIPSSNTTYGTATTGANGLMTSAQVTKLNGIAEGANNYVHPTATSRAIGMYKVKVDGTGHVTSATAIAKADITGLGIPAQDTTYAAATTAAQGLMTTAQVSKLDGIETGANKYVHPTATSYASGLYKVTVDGTGHVTSAAAVVKGDITALGIPSSNTTYGAATTAAQGLMTTAQVSKLDGIAAGANKYVHPTATSYASGLYKVTVDGTGHVTSAAAVAKADITALGIPAQDTTYVHPTATSRAIGMYKVKVDGLGHVTSATAIAKADIIGLGIPAQDTTYGAATTGANGLMTSAQVTKLNGIAEGANNYVHPTATSYASGLYKVTVDGTGHVTSAAAVAKADITALGIPSSNTTYGAATSSASGLMTSAQFSKLAGIETGANKYVHPTATSRASGLYKVTVDGTGHVTSAAAVAKSDITALGIPSSNTTYGAATTAALGLTKKAYVSGETLYFPE